MASALAAAWDRAYLGTPPWDIGRPQQAFADVADELAGTVVEFGCGTGEQTLLAAAHGAGSIGMDVSPRAIAAARDKAAVRGLAARFEVADVLDAASLPDDLVGVADVVIDSGTFHMFDESDRRRYALTAARVARPGARCLLLCVRPDPTRGWGPAGVTTSETAAAFGDGWELADDGGAVFETTGAFGAIPARMIVLERAQVGAAHAFQVDGRANAAREILAAERMDVPDVAELRRELDEAWGDA